jgi:hypothetical protein
MEIVQTIYLIIFNVGCFVNYYLAKFSLQIELVC